MSDLEMTKLCAEAMGRNPINIVRGEVTTGEWGPNYFLRYDPLHDDAQAMAVVKKMRLYVVPKRSQNGWLVTGEDSDAVSPDLNRAIVECVAQMQASRSTAAKGSK